MNDPQAPRAPEPRARLKTLLLALALVLATLALIASQEARLKRLASRWSQTEAAASPDSSVRVGPLTVRDAPFIVEGLSMTLAPGEGGEILGIRNLVWVLAPWVFVAITFKEWILVLDG